MTEIVITPDLTRLGAELRAMGADRELILRGSVTPNGWPGWWSHFYDRPGGWRAFQRMVCLALDNDRAGVPIENTLWVLEHNRATYEEGEL